MFIRQRVLEIRRRFLHRKRARCARSLSAQALHGKRTMRAACPIQIGRPGKQPAGSIQAESAPKVGYRGVGARLEAVEHGSYAPDGPLGAMQHSSESRLLEPFTTGIGREHSAISRSSRDMIAWRRHHEIGLRRCGPCRYVDHMAPSPWNSPFLSRKLSSC